MRSLRIPLVLALLCAIPLPASAQRGELPPLASLSGREARWVGTLERVARGTLGCVVYESDRGGEEYSDERCWEWYDRLETTGRAGVHATGRVLLAALAEDARGAAPPETLPAAQSRLVQLLGSSEQPDAVPYLVHALAHARGPQPRHVQLAVEALDALGRVAAQDVTPLPPWESPHDALASRESRADLAARWGDWYRDHADSARRAWVREGLDRAQAQLTSDDPVQRFAAIRRLDDRGRAHVALQAALRDLIARPSLSASARRYVVRYARRHGLLTRDDVRAVLASRS